MILIFKTKSLIYIDSKFVIYVIVLKYWINYLFQCVQTHCGVRKLKISYIFTCGRLESLYKILCLTQQGEETASKEKVIEQYKKDLSVGRSFEETELYQLIEQSEEKIVINRLNNILRDKPVQQKKDFEMSVPGIRRAPFDFQEYKTGAWSEFNDYKLAVRFSNAKTLLSEKHFEKTGEYMTSRGVAKLTGFNPANIKNMLQHKRAIVKKMLITLEKLAEEY